MAKPALAGFCFSYTIRETMSRTSKQILYGFLYFGVPLAVAGIIFLPGIIKPAPTCTDGIQNQGEAGVDCSGPCEDCELKTLRLQVGGVDIVGVGEKSSLLVKVENPSVNYGALNVLYQFKVLDPLGGTIEAIEGTLNILDAEEKYIAVPGIDAGTYDIGEVVFKLGDFRFVPKKDYLKYDVDVGQAETTFPEGSVDVRGLVANNSGFDIPKLILTAVLRSKDGDLANVGATLIDDLGSFEKRDFLISIPHSGIFVDPEQTEISWRII